MYSFAERRSSFFFFFFNDTATTEIYTLSLHDALPISGRPSRGSAARSYRSCTRASRRSACRGGRSSSFPAGSSGRGRDRKSTRLNSSHANISYAVFCLKKKKERQQLHTLLMSKPHRPQ